MTRLRSFSLALAALLLVIAGTPPAAAVCTPNICYIDLGAGGGVICNLATYTITVAPQPFPANDPATACNETLFQSAVVTANIPNDCAGVVVWVEYAGQPEGWTVNIGDSITNDGFGGDAGTLPAGQNAEVQVLDENLSLFTAATVPAEVRRIAFQHLGLTDGTLKFLVRNQFLSWGQPYSSAEADVLERLFFLPNPPAAGENRTLHVGLNRSINNPGRDGCGARRAVLILQP